MKLDQLYCRVCGCEELEERGGVFVCPCCEATFKPEQETERLLAEIEALQDKARVEHIAALRRRLHQRLQEEYTDSDAVVQICRQIRSYLPEDTLACFMEVANCGTDEEYVEALRELDPVLDPAVTEAAIRFTLKSLRAELLLPLEELIERAYKRTDLRKYEELRTLADTEAEK